MMSIQFSEAVLSADEALKQEAATKQMQDLLALLRKGVKYSTLTVEDRRMLLKKGFAKDLVDNLVFFTERFSDDIKSNSQDDLVLGYTHAAFDPSVFACESVLGSLKASHSGRCAYCESQISHSGAGCVSHFRPAWGAWADGHWARDAYYHLAYEQKNLFYSCLYCHEYCKASQFPVQDAQNCSSPSQGETPLLVNPYDDDPRAYIRFNPLTGEAYAFDKFKDYCTDKLGVDGSAVANYAWANPELLPSSLIAENGQGFARWVTAIDIEADRKSGLFKGQITIDVLGLNRPELIRARLNSLQGLYGIYLTHKSELEDCSQTNKPNIEKLMSDHSKHSSYCSASIDAIKSWCSESEPSNKEWLANYVSVLDTLCVARFTKIKPSFSSSLHYMVLESELDLVGKRRIVSLHSSDYLYGSDRNVKTVFLPINWEQDFNNVIKVSSPNIIWEASFSELSETHPIALQSLFANNEIWAEGRYSALA